ncbi:MAG: hypothetical protein ACLRFK_03070 [Alphaproteobacteria bacterium]
MKRIYVPFLFSVLPMIGGAFALPVSGPVASVEYVHNMINQVWGVDYQPIPSAKPYAANMEYLLRAIDNANYILHGKPVTNYGDSKYATKYAANTIIANQAVQDLIKRGKFTLSVKPHKDGMRFDITAGGSFTVDWGDGTVESFTKTVTEDVDDTNNCVDGICTHVFDVGNCSNGICYVTISGQANAYASDGVAAISFGAKSSTRNSIYDISGCLGCVFGTLEDGSQPSFYKTFHTLENVTTNFDNLDTLFYGVYGQPSPQMFYQTFYQSAFGGAVPVKMFAGISGLPAEAMFRETFRDCENLSGIGGPLFKNISGAPAERMFQGVFKGCSNLSGEIPDNLFGTYSSNDTSTASNMFKETFRGCSKLTGDSAKSSFNGSLKYLYDIWKDASSGAVGDMYNGVTNLTDYDSIPSNWL